MLNHQLMQEEGVLVLAPSGRLHADDFQDVARQVDIFMDTNGKLDGLLIEAESFPGWADFSAFISHIRFVREHHRYIRRIAFATDSHALSIFPQVASHFVAAEIKHFPYTSKVNALEWLCGSLFTRGHDEPRIDNSR